jgi:hypothetical protein
LSTVLTTFDANMSEVRGNCRSAESGKWDVGSTRPPAVRSNRSNSINVILVAIGFVLGAILGMATLKLVADKR